MSGAGRPAALALLALAMTSCRPGAHADPRDAPAAPRVVLDSPSGRSSGVAVEVARAPAELERGLMFREKLPADQGMLFVFPETAEHAFWMKNTLIPLDMIFADADGSVVGVIEEAEPLTTATRTVGKPSRYVLEVNGGWAAAHGVAPGDRMRVLGVPDIR